MDNYDEGYLRIAEEKLKEIYNLALECARKTVPKQEIIIDFVYVHEKVDMPSHTASCLSAWMLR